MKISVFGLGYVGAVTAACLCRQGHTVVGVDVHPAKVESMRHGRSPIVEPGLPELLLEARTAGLLDATESSADAIARSDVSLVCVGTPSLPGGEQNIEFVENVCGKIRESLKITGKSRHHLLLRSTLLPGNARLIAALFEDFPEVEIVYHPEFLREGSAIEDFLHPTLEVAGTSNGQPPSSTLQELLGPSCQFIEWESAELLKFACNSFHAAKVVFANEIGRLGQDLQIDTRRLMQLFCRDTRLNLSANYLSPGTPYGGSCLPKDVQALKAYAHAKGLQLPLLDSLPASNQIHFQSLLALTLGFQQQKVCLIGLTFKNLTDDLRGSPMLELARKLLEQGHSISIHDPNLEPSTLVGANEKLVSKALPQLSSLLHRDLDTALGTEGLIVISHRCVSLEDLRRRITDQHIIFDLNGWPELRDLPARYERFC